MNNLNIILPANMWSVKDILLIEEAQNNYTISKNGNKSYKCEYKWS